MTRRLRLIVRSSLVPLPDFYFDSFIYPIAPIVSSTRGIVSLIYLLFTESIANSGWKASTGFLVVRGSALSDISNTEYHRVVQERSGRFRQQLTRYTELAEFY